MTTAPATKTADGIVRDLRRQLVDLRVRLDSTKGWLKGDFGELSDVDRARHEGAAVVYETTILQIEDVVRSAIR